jgi:translocation and assembly module TamB
VGVKRKIALGFLAAVVALAVGAVVLLETPWAGDRLCALASARVRSVTGQAVAFTACRIDPLRLQVSARDVRVGPAAAPIFAADAVRVRLAPVQPLRRHLSLAEVVVLHPRIVVALPPASAGASRGVCPPPALEAFEVQALRVEGGSADLRLAGGERVVVDRVDVRAAPVAARRRLNPLAGAGARRAGFEIALAGARLEAGDRTLVVDEARLDAGLSLDLSRLDVRLATADLPGAKVAAAGAVIDLCNPRLDLGVSAQADLPALMAMAGRPDLASEGRIAVDLALSGAASAPEAGGEVRLAGVAIDRWRPGDATAHLTLHGKEMQVDRLEVPMLGGEVNARGTLRWGRGVELRAEASLRDVQLGDLFARLKLPRAWVTMRLNGEISASGTVSPLRLAGQAALDFADFRVLDRPWDAPPPPQGPILDLRRGHVAGTVQIDRAGVRIERAQVRVGAGALAARGMLHFKGERGFELAAEGGVDLGELGHIGSVPVAGVAQLDRAIVRAAPYGNPHVEGLLRVKGLRFLDLDLGEAAASLAYDRFVLRVAGAEGLRGATRYAGEARVDLHAHPPRVLEARWVAQGRLRDIFEAAMPWKPDARVLRDALDGDVVVRGTLEGPAPALDVEFQGEVGTGRLLGRAFDGGRFAGRVESGARAVFEVAELRRGGGVARASGELGFAAPFPWRIAGSFSGARLADLSLPGGEWTGTARGTAALSGSLRDPRVRLDATGEGVAVDGVSLGTVELGGTLEGVRLALAARAGGVRLSGTARTDGAMPFEARADLDEQDVARFFPAGASAGLRVGVRGSATASGSLEELGRARAELRLDSLRGGYGDFRVESEAPVVVSVEGGRVVLHALTLRGANTLFTLRGIREATGELDLDARGSLDLRILGGVVPGVTGARGQLALAAHVGGTVAEPRLVGSGTLRDAGCRLRGAPITFSGVAGDLTFSQNRLLFDRLDARVNGGRAELQGEVELSRFVPSRVRVGVTAEEVPVRIPEYLPAVVSGRLLIAGTPDAMLLSGRLHVIRALYTEPVDLERRVLEMGRKRPAPTPARGGDWLGFDLTLLVDGDVRIENDLVRGSASGELALTGTAAAYGLVGTLTLGEGSRATFRGNEFILSNAVAEFTDRRSVRVVLDVHGDAAVRDYQVFMHLYGPYEGPTLTLTSEPALSQPDIVTLLSLGYTTRDAPSGAGVSGAAAAAAAQALFSAAGLDEQVRRFVPRSRLLRDFSLRMTSAYSEGTGQIEPRAEFESKVLDDSMRLRYQAPISGARGQRFQAELRLSEHTSVQYQWDNDNSDVAAVAGGDHGLDLKLRWEWTD